MSKEVTNKEKQIKATSRRDVRALAFHIVYTIDRLDYELAVDDAARMFRTGFDVEIPDDSYALLLSRGAVEHRGQLDDLIKPQLKNWSIDRLGICTLLILRLALFELSQPDAISSVIINEAVELAKAFAEKDAFRFVNGVLDSLSRSEELKQLSSKLAPLTG